MSMSQTMFNSDNGLNWFFLIAFHTPSQLQTRVTCVNNSSMAYDLAMLSWPVMETKNNLQQIELVCNVRDDRITPA